MLVIYLRQNARPSKILDPINFKNIDKYLGSCRFIIGPQSRDGKKDYLRY